MRVFINRIAGLIIKHLEGTISDVEQVELNEWLARSEQEQKLFDQLTDPKIVSSELEKFYSYDPETGWEKLINKYPLQKEQPSLAPPFFSRTRWAAAAILLLAVGLGIYYMLQKRQVKTELAVKTAQPQRPDIAAPKISKASITLANGKTVLIDSIGNGTLAVEGNVDVTKNASGQIIYKGGQQAPAALQYNTLTNPRGSQVVSLTLSDGTKVWLNAESSIHYPVVFIGNERKIYINGEAYLEVAKDPTKKFQVQSNGTITEVLGTHFNVNAYENEVGVKVTLLEGSVKVFKNELEGLLKPGQQARVDKTIKITDHVDLEEVMAWKNGMFSFKGADINTIMRQVGRWYDVDVEFKDNITEKFYGDISRNTNVSKLFKMLETTGGVHFIIEGKKVEVRK